MATRSVHEPSPCLLRRCCFRSTAACSVLGPSAAEKLSPRRQALPYKTRRRLLPAGCGTSPGRPLQQKTAPCTGADLDRFCMKTLDSLWMHFFNGSQEYTSELQAFKASPLLSCPLRHLQHVPLCLLKVQMASGLSLISGLDSTEVYYKACSRQASGRALCIETG